MKGFLMSNEGHHITNSLFYPLKRSQAFASDQLMGESIQHLNPLNLHPNFTSVGHYSGLNYNLFFAGMKTVPLNLESVSAQTDSIPLKHKSNSVVLDMDCGKLHTREYLQNKSVESFTLEESQKKSLSKSKVLSDRALDFSRNKSVIVDDSYKRNKVLRTFDHNMSEDNPSSPDSIIVLSDEEAPMINGHINGYDRSELSTPRSDDLGELLTNGELKELCPEELQEREKVIKKLKEELRNEEAKLIMLKKLRQSQQMKENVVVPPQPGKVPINRNTNNIPPPLIRGQSLQSKPPSQPASQVIMPSLIRGIHLNPQSRPQNVQGPPPLVMASRNPATLPANVMLQQGLMRSSTAMRTTPVTTPPNVVMGYPIQSSSQLHSQPPPPVDTQTPAQRQAAAKLALRKQLEKTLLQIPPPKPPPPEMHFIPSAVNPEFIYLVGLEEVVKYITEHDQHKHQDLLTIKESNSPYVCVQCGTDFTPVWKRDKHSIGSVICEACVTSNQKKALRAEHTNRLKTAFVKALQQEQEIEQRMQSQSSSPVTSGSSSALSKMSDSLRHPVLHPHHLQISRLQTPQPAHMMSPFNPLLATSIAYPYQVLAKPVVATADMQRQYLLDMIPPRSIPQGTVSWKS